MAAPDTFLTNTPTAPQILAAGFVKVVSWLVLGALLIAGWLAYKSPVTSDGGRSV